MAHPVRAAGKQRLVPLPGLGHGSTFMVLGFHAFVVAILLMLIVPRVADVEGRGTIVPRRFRGEAVLDIPVRLVCDLSALTRRITGAAVAVVAFALGTASFESLGTVMTCIV